MVSQKQVTFGDLTIKEYPIILGDHPSCTGAPITIGWGKFSLCSIIVKRMVILFYDCLSSRLSLTLMPFLPSFLPSLLNRNNSTDGHLYTQHGVVRVHQDATP